MTTKEWLMRADKQEMNNLAIAIVRQAIDDWRYLCKKEREAKKEGKSFETKDCNFRELTKFFKNDCANYLIGTNISANRVWVLLQQERRRNV